MALALAAQESEFSGVERAAILLMYLERPLAKSLLDRMSDDEVRKVMQNRAPQFRALSGLVQKYYGYEDSTGMHTGIYIWDSEESMREFAESELAKTIPEAYQVETQPRVEIFEMIFPLRESRESVGTAAE